MAGKILIVEDEAAIARFVELELRHEGYAVDKAEDGRSGLDQALAETYDLILLDIMLPGLSGLEVLRRLRREKDTPVILLTARDTVMDKVSGLDMGADDYITKPFAIEELLARIRTALRKRPPKAPDALLTLGPITMDTARRQVRCGGQAVELTTREFDVLRLFLENPEIVLSRETFLSKVWGYDYVGETNVVDVYIRYLRSKLDAACGRSLIHTVRGVGYVLRED
ncbi:MAG TPA: response regulator transcription factor [Candidatus Avoscillospira stercorigallinarum]|uniref:Stage 0 sporulation protein A homolog n=1 Tax=Candidatus Avoscillospira stercorigallinarum TaxID=2840708 RepID=A0A9D1CN85_9FIRM|nr:response regulator transcription factor [Candidatus Avoscillospira stercorigallinarum]